MGKLVEKRVAECNMDTFRICRFFKCTDHDLSMMYQQRDMSSDLILKWSKLLEYDFFRIYSQHLILYSPQAKAHPNKSTDTKKTVLPMFRKNIYTKEIIDFIMELILTGEKTRNQVIEEYRIPKTTLFKWMDKYSGKVAIDTMSGETKELMV